MAYTPLSPILVSDIASELSVDSTFSALTSVQYIPLFNTVQEQIANLYFAQSLTPYQVVIPDVAVNLTGTQSMLGTYGYVVTIDMTSNTPNTIFQVVMRNSATNVLSTPSNTMDTMVNIATYPMSSGAPNFSWTQAGDSLVLFLNSSVYSFGATSKVTTFLYRDTIPVTLVSNQLDIPMESRRLFGLLATLQAYRISGKRPPAYTVDGIQNEEANLGLLPTNNDVSD